MTLRKSSAGNISTPIVSTLEFRRLNLNYPGFPDSSHEAIKNFFKTDISSYNKLFGITTYLLDENETIEDLERYKAETEEEFQIVEQAVSECYANEY